MTKVLLTEPYVEATDIEPLDRLREIAEVCVARSPSEAQLVKEVKDASALIVRLARITRRIIDSGETLKVIGSTSVGVDNIDVDAATEKGIFVCTVPAGHNAYAVAEHTFAMILALTKNLVEADNRLRKEGWMIRDHLWPRSISVHGKTLGIIGLGAIGSKVATVAKAFGMKILTYDPYVSEEKAKAFGAKLLDLDTLLAKSDIVTIHCPLTEENRNLINQSKIELMRNTAFLINCGRGPIVNQDALVSALKEMMIAGAAVDVFEKEPINRDNPLLKLKNLIVTPHVAGLTYEVRVKVMETLIDDVISVLKGEAPRNAVNF